MRQPPNWEIQFNLQYVRDMFMRVTKLNLVEKNASATFDRIYSRYMHAYNIKDESSEQQWYKLYVMVGG